MPPPDGSDFLTVGGNLSVTAANRREVGGISSGTTVGYGNVQVGGTATGTIGITPTGQLFTGSDAYRQYQDLVPVLESRSACAAGTAANGTVVTEAIQVTFHGDGTSPLPVFDVPGDIGAVGAPTGIAFTGIPAGATVIVNMTGANPVVSTYTGSGQPGGPLFDLGPNLLWNFPNASTATVAGGTRFSGSIITGKADSTLTISASGTGGRVYAAGNIVMNGTGNELHAYPFDGSIPDCQNGSESASPSPSESASPSESPSESQSPSESASPSESPSESASASESAYVSASPIRSMLAETGSGSGPSLGLAAGTLLAAGLGTAATAAITRRRSSR